MDATPIGDLKPLINGDFDSIDDVKKEKKSRKTQFVKIKEQFTRENTFNRIILYALVFISSFLAFYLPHIFYSFIPFEQFSLRLSIGTGLSTLIIFFVLYNL